MSTRENIRLIARTPLANSEEPDEMLHSLSVFWQDTSV